MGELDWGKLGLKSSRDGWLSEDPELIDQLTIRGGMGWGRSLGFWLARDARSLKIWGMWAVAGFALALGAWWRDLPTLGLGVIFSGFYCRNLYSMVAMWGRGKLQRGIVRALEPHPAPGSSIALLEGQPTRVAMKEHLAQTALMRLGRFEVLFFEEPNPKACALELAFRPAQLSAAPTDEPRS